MRRVGRTVAKAILRRTARLVPYPIKGGIRFGFVPGARSLNTGDMFKAEPVKTAVLVHRAWTAKRRLPKKLLGEESAAFQREKMHALPGAAAALLPGGRVWGREGAVFDRDGFLIAEPARSIGHYPFDWRERYSLVRPKPRRLSGRWGVLTGCGCHGFFH